MESFWTRIWIWIKVGFFAIVFIYLLLFIIENLQNTATVWYSFKRTIETSTLMLALLAYLAGVASMILVRTSTTTLRQLREARERNRSQRLHRDVEEMKVKAAMLQPKAPGDSAAKI